MSQSAKKTIYWLISLGLVGLAIYGIYQVAKSGGGPLPGQFFPAQSRNHINIGANHPNYNSNPPTGGWHYDNPAQTGIYDKELPDEQLIHNLEHGHVWISYRPDLPKDQQDKLAGIAKGYGARIIVTPRAKTDSPVALAAWQYLLKLDNIDGVQINAFIKAHRNIAGPEKNIPDYGFGDFREQK